MSPGYAPRPSLSVFVNGVTDTILDTVSPGYAPRPSLSEAGRSVSRYACPISSVAGVCAPAFVERRARQTIEVRATARLVSPGYAPRPSLSAVLD